METYDLMKNMTIIRGEEQEKIRDMYYSSFVDTGRDNYRRYIEVKHMYSDGYCYNGYLWDNLINPILMKECSLAATVKKLKGIYVLWDIHSCERIFIEDYWKFGKENILLLDGDVLMQSTHLLPEDIYIFDESYAWTIVFTHECINGERYCLISGDVSIVE